MIKLLLGHAIVLEALLPPAPAAETSARGEATPTKQSFGDKCVTKLEPVVFGIGYAVGFVTRYT